MEKISRSAEADFIADSSLKLPFVILKQNTSQSIPLKFAMLVMEGRATIHDFTRPSSTRQTPVAAWIGQTGGTSTVVAGRTVPTSNFGRAQLQPITGNNPGLLSRGRRIQTHTQAQRMGIVLSCWGHPSETCLPGIYKPKYGVYSFLATRGECEPCLNRHCESSRCTWT